MFSCYLHVTDSGHFSEDLVKEWKSADEINEV